MDYLDDERQTPRGPKIRSDDTWAEVRRAWEAGETGASLARRYDVGLANLWRRRASEGWSRRKPADPRPEPVEGWDRHAEAALARFEHQRLETRALAEQLCKAMTGGSLEGTPIWHLAFVLHWRAEHLGEGVIAADRAWIAGRGLDLVLWHEDGTLLPLWWIDEVVLSANREAWREDHDLPPGVAPHVPVPVKRDGPKRDGAG